MTFEQPKVVLKIAQEGEGAGRCEIRLVSFSGQEPVLEKRQFIKDKDTGADRGGRVRGFLLKDMGTILQKWPVIHDVWQKFRP